MTQTATLVDDADAQFGRRLREWRRRQGLSQTELGGGRFSGSYVSHVESGRRRATPEMIDFFSARLGIDPGTLDREHQRFEEPMEASELRVTSLTIQATHAYRDHDFQRSTDLAAEAAQIAEQAGLSGRWWYASQQQAHGLFECGRYEECLSLARTLSAHPVISASTPLQLEVTVLATRAARSAGQLSLAEETARAAVELAEQGDWPDYLAQALMSLLGVLMERGQDAEARLVRDRLVQIRDRVDSAQLRGTVYWITGNVDLLGGSATEGARDHDRAATLLRPDVDLRSWGRFHKATVQVRLAAGITDGVASYLEKARQALLLVGNSSDRTELRLLEARLALVENDLDRAERLVEFCLGDEELNAAPHSRAEAEVLRADVAVATGDRVVARQALQAAALHFEEAGALRRSVGAWRRHAELGEHLDGR